MGVLQSQIQNFSNTSRIMPHFLIMTVIPSMQHFQEQSKIPYEMAGNTEDSIMIFSDNIQAQNSSKHINHFKSA
jgi:hypothetical protein